MEDEALLLTDLHSHQLLGWAREDVVLLYLGLQSSWSFSNMKLGIINGSS